MSEALKVNTTRSKAILLVDSADHITGKPGMAAALTIYAKKNGGAAALITPTVTETSAVNMPGHYDLLFTTSHMDTLGDFAVHISGSGIDPCDFILPIEVERVGAIADKTGFTLSAFGFAVTVGTNNDKLGYGLSAGERISTADALLTRDMSAVTGEAARSPLNAFRFLRNLWRIVSGTLTVMKEDDVTPAWTATVETTAGNPVSKIDPT